MPEKELTDREWAELVKQRLAKTESKVDVEIGEPRIERKMTDEEWAKEVKGATPARALEDGPEVEVKVGEPTKVSRVRDWESPPEETKRNRDEYERATAKPDGENYFKVGNEVKHREDMTDADWKRAQRDAKSPEGSVFMQNTDAEGNKKRGAEVKRSEFSSDDEFDQFVRRRREKGQLWEGGEKDEEKAEGSGGGFFSRVKKGVDAFTKGAIPSGAGGGNPDNGTGRPATANLDVSDVSAGGPPAQAPGMSADSSAYAGGQGAFPPGAFASGALGAGGGGGASASDAGNVDAPVSPGPGSRGDLRQPGAPPPAEVAYSGPMAAPEMIPQSGESASASLQMPAMSAPGFGQAKDYSKQIQTEAGNQAAAVQGAADIESAQQQALGQILQSRENEISKRQIHMQSLQERSEEAAQKQMSTITEAQKLLNSPAKTPDPERYWQNHSKIMFAIGVGLLAQAGKDINGVLSNTSRAIERDIEQQKATFEAPRDAARARMAGAKDLYGMIRQQGHDAFETDKIMGALGNDFYANQVDKLAANSNSEVVKARAMQMSAGLRQQGYEKMQQADQHARTNAVAEYNAKTNRMELGIKAQAAFSKHAGGGKQLPAADAEKLGKLETARRLLEDSAADFERISGSLPAALGSKISANVPRTEANDYNRRRKAFLRTIGLLVDESVIQKHDADAWEELYPEAGNLNGKPSLDALKQSIREKFNDKLGAYSKAGFNVSNFGGEQSEGGGQEMVLPSGERVLVR